MKFQIDAGELSRVAALAASVINSRNTRPVLAYCLIESAGDELSGELTITATNLDQSLKIGAQATVQTPGAALLPAQFLAAYARTLSSGTLVTIDAADGEPAVISARGAKHKMPTVPVEDFPAVPEEMGFAPDADFESNPKAPRAVIAMRAGAMREMLGMTAIACSKSVEKTLLTGVLCAWCEARFTMVATNTHRLTKFDAPPAAVQTCCAIGKKNIVTGDVFSAVVPPEAIGNWQRMLDGCKEDETATLMASDSLFQVSVRAGEATKIVLLSRLLDGQYPNYKKVIPTSGRGVGVSADDLASALQRLALSRPNADKVVFTLEAGGDADAKTLRLTAQGETNTGDEELVVTPELANSNDAPAGWEEMRWAINIIYLREFLTASKSTLGAKSVIMHASERESGFAALSPFTCFVTAGEPADVVDGLLHILMPMAV